MKTINIVNSLNSLYESLGKKYRINDSKKLTLDEINLIKKELKKNPNIKEKIEQTLKKENRESKFLQWQKLGDISLLLREVRSIDKSSNYLLAIDKIRQLYLKITESSEWGHSNPLNELGIFLGLSCLEENEWKHLSRLNIPQEQQINKRLLAHIHGGNFIPNTGLEGAPLELSLDYLSLWLQSKSESIPQENIYSDLSKIFKEASLLQKIMTAGNEKNFRTRCKNFQEQLAKHIGNLAPKQKTLLPACYTSLEGGHAIYLEVERQENHSLKMRIFNSGEGVPSFHPYIINKEEMLVLPYIELHHVKEENFLNETFLRAYLEVGYLAYTHTQEWSLFSVEDVYTLLLTGLEGEIVRPLDKPAHFIPPQISGNCTWASLIAMLHSYLPKDEFDKMNLEICLDSLCSFYQQHFSELDNEDILLLTRSITLLAQQGLDAYHRGSISKERLEVIYSTLQELSIEISQYCNRNKPMEVPFFIDFSKVETSSIDLGKIQIIDHPLIKSAEAQERIASSRKNIVELEAITNLDRLPLILNDFYTTQMQALQAGEIDSVRVNIHHLFEAFSNTDLDKILLEKSSIDQIRLIVAEFDKISELIFQTRGVTNRNPALETYTYYLLVISFEISKKLPEMDELLTEFPTSTFNYCHQFCGIATKIGVKGDLNLFEPFQRKLRDKILELTSNIDITDTWEWDQSPFIFNTPSSYFIGGSQTELSLSNQESSIPYFPKEAQIIVKKLREDPQFKIEILDFYPFLKNKSDIEAAATILCDLEGKWLSKPHAALRKQALICWLIELNYYKEVNSPPIQLYVENNIQEKKFCLQPQHVSKWDIEKVRENEYGELTNRYLQYIIATARQISGDRRQLIGEDHIVNGTLNYANMPLKLTEKDIKDFLLLMTHGDFNDAEPYREQQVIKTISYFTTTIQRLEDPQMQAFFKLLVFESNYLETLLKENPALKDIIDTFIFYGLSHFYERGDIKTASFFIEFGRCFDHIKSYLGINNSPFLVRDYLMKAINTGSFHANEKTMLYQQLIASYISQPPVNFSKDDAIWLVKGLIYLQTFSNKESLTKLTAEQILMATSRYQNKIEEYFKNKNGSQLCQSILQELIPEEASQEWDCQTTYPICSTQDKKYSLDVATGLLSLKAGSLISLPFFIQKSSHFVRELYEPGQLCEQINPTTYRFKDKRGFLTEIQWDITTRQAQIIQEIPGKGRYILANNLFNDDKEKTSLAYNINYLIKSNSCWIKLDNEANSEVLLRNRDYQPKYLIKLDHQPSSLSRSPINQSTLYYFALRSIKTLFIDREIEQILILKMKLLRGESSIELSDDDEQLISPFTNWNIGEICKLIKPEYEFRIEELETHLAELRKILQGNKSISLANILSCHAISKSSDPLQLVQASSNLPEIIKCKSLIWKNKDDQLVKIEIPAFNLKFKIEDVKGIKKAFCQELPGYFIASNQKITGLNLPFQDFLVVENKSGQRKVIITQGKITPEKRGALCTNYKISTKGLITSSITYELDAERTLKATSNPQKIYLASLYLAEKQYNKGLETLRAVTFTHTPISEKEKELIKALLVQLIESQDVSPEGCALILKVFSMLDSPFEINTSLNYLKNYFNFKSTIPSLTLSEDEIVRAIKSIEELINKSLYININIKINSEILELFMMLRSFNINFEFSKIRSHLIQEERIKNNIYSEFDSHLFFKLCDYINKNSSTSKEEILLTRPVQDLYSLFLDFYKLAKQSDSSLRGLLLVIQRDERAPLHLVNFLKNVLDNPPAYPPVEEMHKILITSNWQTFSKLIKNKQNQRVLALEQKQLIKFEKSVKHPRSAQHQNLYLRTDSSLSPLLQPIQQPSAILKNPTTFFRKEASESIKFSSTTINELAQSLTGEFNHNEMSVESKKIDAEIRTYWSAEERNSPWHIIDKNQLEKVKVQLMVTKAEREKRLFIESLELLNLANSLPLDLKKKLIIQTEKVGKLRSEITLEDLYIAAARYQFFSVVENNPDLAAKEKELIQRTIQFLANKAHIQQINRALGYAKELEKLEESSGKYKKLSENLYIEVTRKPPYLAHENPKFVLFEVLTELGLFAGQVKDLNELNFSDSSVTNLILQKVMGSGKTKVYLSLLALSKADGKKIPFVVVPESQYTTVAQAMEIQSKGIFHQKARALSFDYTQLSTSQGRKAIIQELNDALIAKDFFVTTDKSMHRFITFYKQALHDYFAHDFLDPEMDEKIQQLKEIKQLLNGKAIVDEADLINNCRQEHILAAGEAKAINEKHCDLVADLYEAIENVINSAQPFTREKYDKTLKRECIQAFIPRFLAIHHSSANPQKIYDYLMGGKEGADYLETLQPLLKDLLAIALQEFSQLLPLTLEKRCGEHFGYSDLPEKILPVPYLASGVPGTSEYSFPYTLLNFTLQTLQAEGISIHLLEKIISHMQASAIQELQYNPSMKLENTIGYQAFQDLCGHEIAIPFYRVEESDLKNLRDYYQNNPRATRNFAKRYLFPEVKQFESLIISTPYTLNSLFSEVIGFTGTPWNEKTYHNSLVTKTDPASSGKIVGVIWNNSQKIQELKEISSLKEAVANMVKLQNQDGGGYHAFIDVGALFLGVDNEQVALEFLKQNPTIKGVVFFKDNLPHVAERNKIDYTPFSKTLLKPEELFIYYDQWHTTGTDLLIAGKSFLSIGKTTTRRDLEQAYMRDRQAENGSRVHLLVPENVKEFIKEDLQIENPEVDLKAILRHCQKNQEKDLNEQMMMAALGKMKDVLDNHLFKLLNTENIDPSLLFPYKATIRAILVESMLDSPFAKMGQWSGEYPAKEVFESIIQEMANKINPLCLAFPNILNDKEIEIELWDCVDLELFPEKLSFAMKNNPGQFAEQISQQQTQQETTALTEKEKVTAVNTQKKSRYLCPHWNWDTQNSEDYYKIYSLEDIKHMTPPHTPHSGRVSESTGNVPIMQMSNIFASCSDLQNYQDVFQLEASYNFFPLERENFYSKTNNDLIAPFNEFQKKVQNVLILQQPQSNPRLILLSQADAAYFFHKLSLDRQTNQRPELSVSLYNINLGLIQSNHSSILDKTQEFMDEKTTFLITQAKFYNGELIYTPQELSLLKKWFEEKGYEKMKELFLQHILRFKSDKKEKYINSQLAYLL